AVLAAFLLRSSCPCCCASTAGSSANDGVSGGGRTFLTRETGAWRASSTGPAATATRDADDRTAGSVDGGVPLTKTQPNAASAPRIRNSFAISHLQTPQSSATATFAIFTVCRPLMRARRYTVHDSCVMHLSCPGGINGNTCGTTN